MVIAYKAYSDRCGHCDNGGRRDSSLNSELWVFVCIVTPDDQTLLYVYKKTAQMQTSQYDEQAEQYAGCAKKNCTPAVSQQIVLQYVPIKLVLSD